MFSLYVFVLPSESVKTTLISCSPKRPSTIFMMINDKSSVVVPLNTNSPSRYTSKWPFVKFNSNISFKAPNVIALPEYTKLSFTYTLYAFEVVSTLRTCLIVFEVCLGITLWCGFGVSFDNTLKLSGVLLETA